MASRDFTPEELNYFRVSYITTNVIREGLREFFKQEWDRHHSAKLGLWQDTAKNGQDFYNMESKKSRSKNSKLLKIIQNGNTEEWDCTCFFFAILYSDSLGKLTSSTVTKSVDDLRIFRNEVFAHLSKASILEADFQASVSKVSLAFTSLHLDTKELHRISNQTSFPTRELQMLQKQVSVLEEELQGKPKSFMVLPPQPSHEVVERKSEVEDIMELFTDLQNTNNDDSVVTVYVSGNPGCGKSQIAREIGKQFFEKEATEDDHDSCTFVMTLDAESEQSMLNSYYKFACKVGVTEYSLNSITGGDSKLIPIEKISHLKTLVSSKVQNYCNWLLVFDNVSELESIRNCWPDEDWGGCGHVLVTTQDSSNLPTADPLCKSISLSEGMQHEDARCLLRRVCQFSCDAKEEDLVLSALDHQPLAIACAALYAQYTEMSKRESPGSAWKNYLEKLETLEKRVSTEKVYKRTSKSYRSSMTSAVTLALEKLLQEKGFEHVVQFLALGAPEPIDIDFIVSYVSKQDPGCDKDMTAAEIARCSLLMKVCPDDSSTVLIKMHQVVYDVFKKYLRENYSREQIASFILSYIETLSTPAQHDPLHFDLEFHISSKMMAPHLKSLSWSTCMLKLSDLILGVADRDKRNLLQSTFFSFGDICRKHLFLLEALDYFGYALKIGKDDFDGQDKKKISFLATIINNEGLVYHESGYHEIAEAYYVRALEMFEEIHPQNTSPEIADSLNKLGNVYYSRGMVQKAKDYFQKSLNIREQLYGHEHPDVAASLSNLGFIHILSGDLETASDFIQRSLALRKRIYGEVHPHVADSLTNLGILYSKIGVHDKAVQLQEQALEMRKGLFFRDHVLISDSYNNLALAYKGVGEFEQAEEGFESALHIRERTSGKQHPAVARLLINLSCLYKELGEMEKFEDFQDRAQSVEPLMPLSRHKKGFIPSDEPGQLFEYGSYYYGFAMAQGATSSFDPLPPEKYAIKVTPESSSFL